MTRYLLLLIVAQLLLSSCTQRRYASRTTLFRSYEHETGRFQEKEGIRGNSNIAEAELKKEELSHAQNCIDVNSDDDFQVKSMERIMTNVAIVNPSQKTVSTMANRLKVLELISSNGLATPKRNMLKRVLPERAREDGDIKLDIFIMLYFLIGFILLSFLMSLFTGWTAAVALKKGLVIGLAFCVLYVLMSA